MADQRLHSATKLLAEAGPTMSVRDASRVLGCSAATVYEMDKRGELAAMGIRVLQLGRKKRILTTDLRRVVGGMRS